MSEQLAESYYTDEVCQEWYEREKASGGNGAGMPDGVRAYLVDRIEGFYEQFAPIDEEDLAEFRDGYSIDHVDSDTAHR